MDRLGAATSRFVGSIPTLDSNQTQAFVGDYILTYDKGLLIEWIDDRPAASGIRFVHAGYAYEVILCTLGERLIITQRPTTGYCRDIPFHLGTAHLLPPGVRVDDASLIYGYKKKR